VLAGTALAALASLFGDALVVQWTKSRYPSLSNYSHFRLADYGTLTIVGVLGAGFAWWLVTRSVGTPRRVFFRVALVVTVVLWLPDLWLLVRGEPGRAIAALALMHVVVAVVTYNVLVHVAPLRPASAADVSVNAIDVGAPPVLVSRDASAASRRRSVWVTMTTLVVAEFVLGLVGMLYVPFSRPNGWISHQGAGLYLAHAVLGGALGLAAGAIVFVVRRDPRASRLERIAAMVGVWGVVVGAIGGGLCYSHSLRLLGMALMFVGVSVAFFGYLIPLLGEDHGATAIRDAHS
jgi:hypothetical protein